MAPVECVDMRGESLTCVADRHGTPPCHTMAEKQGPYEFEPAWRNSSEKKCMRIGNDIELQTDEKNIKVCTWLEHMFSNICFQNQIGRTTNVLFIKRKFEHHYKGNDRYMEMIDIYFFIGFTNSLIIKMFELPDYAISKSVPISDL